MFKLAFRSKNPKVQPTNKPDLKVPNEGFEFVESQNGFKCQRSLHSIPEESMKGTCEGSNSSVEDSVFTVDSALSIKRIGKEVKSLRVIVVALVVVSIVSFALNIWIIHALQKGW